MLCRRLSPYVWRYVSGKARTIGALCSRDVACANDLSDESYFSFRAIYTNTRCTKSLLGLMHERRYSERRTTLIPLESSSGIEIQQTHVLVPLSFTVIRRLACVDRSTAAQARSRQNPPQSFPQVISLSLSLSLSPPPYSLYNRLRYISITHHEHSQVREDGASV